MYKLEDQGWLGSWQEGGLSAFRAALHEASNIFPSLALRAGLEHGDISPAQAIGQFFVSCFGDKTLRTQAAQEWEEQVMARHGLQPAAPYQIAANKAVAFDRGSGYVMSLTRFDELPPSQLEAAFAHPRLTGWKLLGGAISEHPIHIKESEARNTGVAAFERDGRRLLVMLLGIPGGGYRVLPVGEGALRKDLPPSLGFGENGYYFTIEYQDQEGWLTRFTISPQRSTLQGHFVCRVHSFERIHQEHGNSFEARSTFRGWELYEYKANMQVKEAVQPGGILAYMEALEDAQSIPTTLEGWMGLPQRLLQEGIASLGGVNFREKTSSRSRNQGYFLPGTLVKILGYESGNPDPWLKGQIGSLTGYAAMSYVNAPEHERGQPLSGTAPLPVARARADMDLKKETGLFAGSVTHLQGGTRMHVLSEQGEWLYVAVPREELGWLMDVDGSFGYVKRDAVDLAATRIQLAWMAED